MKSLKNINEKILVKAKKIATKNNKEKIWKNKIQGGWNLKKKNNLKMILYKINSN